MKRIKWGSVLMAGILCMSTLAGCGFTPINAPTEQEVINEQDYDGEVALILSQKDDEFLSYLDQAAKAAASAKDCNLYSVDCDGDMYRQIEFVQTAVENQVGAVIVELVDDSCAQEVIDAAGDTPVIFLNRIPQDVDLLDDTHVYVGSNESEAGELQGEELVSYFEEKDQDSINYLMFRGTKGLVNTTQRSESVLKTLEDAGIEATAVVEPMDCDYSRSSAKKKMDMLLDDGLDMSTVDCIIANNDAMALGVIESLEENDIDTTDIAIVGVDGTNAGLKAIRQGQMTATVYQDAAGQASACVQMAINLALGSDFMTGVNYEQDAENSSIVWVPFELVTLENVNDFH